MEDSIFATVLLPLALAVIMASLGMSLTPEDFKRVLVKPRGVSIGLLNLALLSPLLAFAVAHAFSLEPALAVGLVLLGASPGGIMANLLTHFARGDTALSITMTAFSSLAAVLTVPLFLGLATSHFGATHLDEQVSMLGVVARVLFITVVPLAIGLWLRTRHPEWVAESRRHRAPDNGASLHRGRRRRDRGRARPRPRQPRRRGRRGGHAQRRRDVHVVLDRAPGPARQPAVDRDRDRARHPQRRSCDRRRGNDRERADRPRRGLRELHVHPRRALRLADVRAKRGLPTAERSWVADETHAQ